VSKLQVPLTLYADATGIGETLASPADISTREDRLVQPDIYIIPENLHHVTKWAEITHLLLVVEVLSPSTARADRQVKRRLYSELADEYWIVDLDARLVERWRPGDERPEIVTDRLVWQPIAATPFQLDLPQYFAEVGTE
jgi:Uma2 family endonuclease